MRASILPSLIAVTSIAALVGFARMARAADPKEWGDEAAASDEAQKPPPAPTPDPAAAEPAQGAEGESAPADEGTKAEPVESEEEKPPGAPSDYALGVRYRGVFIPKAVLNWFVEGGDSIYVHGMGPEFSIRDDNVEYVLSAWLALYGLDPVPLKSTSDAEEAWEIVDASLKSIYVTFDYLWHTRLASTLELSYGGGAGIGYLFGSLSRQQATLVNGGTPGNPADYVPCTGVNNPPQGGYCDDINDHYGDYGEPNWFHGGAKPVLFPWLTGQVGLRYQPHPNFIARLDLGLGTSGLYFGVGADYGL
ncbi:MAG: hypothetical protein RL685_966 [Pseudomonadota bacterium]